jgi:hypothetical protein
LIFTQIEARRAKRNVFKKYLCPFVTGTGGEPYYTGLSPDLKVLKIK